MKNTKLNIYMVLRWVLILIVFMLSVTYCQGQQLRYAQYNLGYPVFKYNDSGKYIINFNRGNCKGYFTQTEFIPNPPVPFIKEKTVTVYFPQKKIKLFTIHGNISYDYFYRSALDAPVLQQDLQQHTEKVFLAVVVKEKYPLKVNFTSRQSNSPYFRNFVDVSFQFDKYAYNKNLKQQILNKMNARIPAIKSLEINNIETQLKKQKAEYTSIKTWLEDPATLQKIIEEREREYFKKIKSKEDSIRNINSVNDTTLDKIDTQKQRFEDRASGFKDNILDKKDSMASDINKRKDSSLSKLNSEKENLTDTLSFIKNRIINKKDSIVDKVKNGIDSITEPYSQLYERKKHQLDSLSKRIEVYKHKADSATQVAQKRLLKVKQKIYNSVSENELKKIAAKNGIDLDKKGGTEKRLSAIKTFSIGRSILDYTELTAKDITINGINIEYNPSFYVAFSAGKIDYRFRDFFNKNKVQNKQYLLMGRLGIGDKDHAALIFSYFIGRKNTSQFSLSDSVKNYANIMGYSVEAIYKKDNNTAISAEFAKSTKPVSGSLQNGKQTGVMWNYEDNSNMGINIKVQTIIPETNTRLSGFYRKTGENFQSFSLFSYNSNQTAWLARADQSFLKSRVSLTTMLRRNDFTNPYTDKTYKTSTVFKSLLLNFRFPKYPSVSVGYYPGSQLYMINKEKIRESAYYILNGSVSYNYSFKKLLVNSSFMVNRYTSEATDSGFISYKGTTYYAMQTVFFKKIQFQGGYSYTNQPELKYYTLEAAGDYSIQSWLRLGIGAKYNNITGGNNYWGQRLQLSVGLKQIGTVQLQYEKSYLPTINKTLFPVEIGRLSYFKNF